MPDLGSLYYTDSLLILYNTKYKSGGMQKLSGAVFCTRSAAEKLTVLYQINGELVLNALKGDKNEKTQDFYDYNNIGSSLFFRMSACLR